MRGDCNLIIDYVHFSVCDEINWKKRNKPIYSVVKRIADVTISFSLIIALLPLFLLISLLIKFNSRDSIIFKQERIGMNGNSFTIYKFRTMKSDAPEISTNEFKNSSEYITGLGRILRKTSLDELPQLFNVLRGDMSIIGPRPLIKGESDIHRKRMSRGIYDLKPGMTGLAQINGRDSISDDEKIFYDYQYLIGRSVFMDTLIFFRTFFSVVKAEGHSEGH